MHKSHKARDGGRAECTQLKRVIYLPNSLRGQQKKKEETAESRTVSGKKSVSPFALLSSPQPGRLEKAQDPSSSSGLVLTGAQLGRKAAGLPEGMSCQSTQPPVRQQQGLM